MSSDDRAELRAVWPIRTFRLGDEPTEIEAHAHLTPGERFLLVRELSARMMALAGRPWPSWEPGAMPARVSRPS